MSDISAAGAIVERLHLCGSPQEIADVWSEWRNSHPQLPDFSGVRFIGLQLPAGINFSQMKLANVRFDNCVAETVGFEKSDLTGAVFSECRLNSMRLDQTKASSAVFEDCNLSAGELRRSKLTGTSFLRCNLRGAVFSESDLTEASFVSVDVNRSTTFQNLTGCTRCRIERFALACLGESNGSLTEGNLMEMAVIDDVARLRQQFGGVWSLVHLASLAVFVFPYAWFLIRQWSIARFITPHVDGKTVALWEALWRFIRTGGVDWKSSSTVNWLPFTTFALILAYNVVRGTLLWKTKKLETEQQVKGLPALFSMEQPVSFCGIRGRWWHWLYQATQYGFWMSLICISLNVWHFLRMRIPL